MSENIVTFFACLMAYRFLCYFLGWAPFPLVQLTVNNTWDAPKETPDDPPY